MLMRFFPPGGLLLIMVPKAVEVKAFDSQLWNKTMPHVSLAIISVVHLYDKLWLTSTDGQLCPRPFSTDGFRKDTVC